MIRNDFSQTFLFTFRPNGQPDGRGLVEVFVEQLAEYDLAAAAGSYKRSWFGTENALGSMLDTLGFPGTDIEGVRR